MTTVLHLQVRAYPLHYGSLGGPAEVPVLGRGMLRLVRGSLGSLAYNPEPTLEADLTPLLGPAVAVPRVQIASCRARLLLSGTMLLVYTLRHDADLRGFATDELDAIDAEVNRELRRADGAVIGEVLAAATEAGVLQDLPIWPGQPTIGPPAALDPRLVRYNAHFVTTDPPWTPDPRVPDLVLGPRCQILLPYTYAWQADPDTPLDVLLTMLEPADVAVAQMSVVFSAMIGGQRMLTELSRANPGRLRGLDFRRFLDRVWSEYHHFDFYRIESGQGHRATYLAATETIGVVRAHGRAGELLDYVGTSLQAESSLRSQQLDRRLNRVAGALTVVVSGALAIDAAAFLLPDASPAVRLAVVVAVLVVSVLALGATVLSVALRARRRGAGTPAWPVPRAAIPSQPSLPAATPPAAEPAPLPAGPD